MAQRTALGRGLTALIPTDLKDEAKKRGGGGDGGSTIEPSALRDVAVDSITTNPNQPRVHFDESTLKELSASIKAIGVLQPLLVRELPDGEYQLIAGERRWRAAKMAGLLEVPVIVRETDDQSSVEQALVENLHRQDLTPLEEAGAYQQLLSDFKLTHEQIASRVGKSRAAVTNTLRLLELPPAIQTLLADGRLTAGHARALIPIEDRGFQEQLARRAADEGWTVRAVENAVRDRLGAGPGNFGGGQRPYGPTKTIKPAGLLELEELLSEYLSTKVIVGMSGRRGRISIDFADLADLERIYRRMSEPEQD